MDRERLNEYAQPIVDMYNLLEQDMIDNISELLANKKDLLETDPEAWKLDKMYSLGLLDKSNIKTIQKKAGLTSSQMNGILYRAGIEGIADTEEAAKKAMKKGAWLIVPPPPGESDTILDIISAYSNQAMDNLNLTRTSMLNNAKQVYKSILDRTVLDSLSGHLSGEAALRKAIRQMASEGIPALIDKAGKKWGIEGYVRMIMKTVTNNTVNKMQDQRLDDWGVDLVEITSHLGARPKCFPFQGRVYSVSGKSKKYPALSSTSIGQADGLFGINCGHNKYPFFEGFSEPTYERGSPAKNHIAYKESQQQRYIERTIRKYKTQARAFRKNDDLVAAAQAEQKVKEWQHIMREFIDQTGRTRRYNREGIIDDSKDNSLPVPQPPKNMPPVPKKPKDKDILNKIPKNDTGQSEPIMHYEKGTVIKYVYKGENYKGKYLGSKGSEHKVEIGNTGKTMIIDDDDFKTVEVVGQKKKSSIKKDDTKKPISKPADKPKEKEDEPNVDIETIVSSKEDEIKNLDYEKAIVFDKNGKVLWEKSGTKNNVDLQDAANKNVLVGNVLTHNHPSNSSFSLADIKLLLNYDLEEIRAIGKNGNLMKASRTSKKKLTIKEAKELEDKITSGINKIKKERKQKMIKGEELDELWHDVWSQLSSEVGIKYTLIKPDKDKEDPNEPKVEWPYGKIKVMVKEEAEKHGIDNETLIEIYKEKNGPGLIQKEIMIETYKEILDGKHKPKKDDKPEEPTVQGKTREELESMELFEIKDIIGKHLEEKTGNKSKQQDINKFMKEYRVEDGFIWDGNNKKSIVAALFGDDKDKPKEKDKEPDKPKQEDKPYEFDKVTYEELDEKGMSQLANEIEFTVRKKNPNASDDEIDKLVAEFNKDFEGLTGKNRRKAMINKILVERGLEAKEDEKKVIEKVDPKRKWALTHKQRSIIESNHKTFLDDISNKKQFADYKDKIESGYYDNSVLEIIYENDEYHVVEYKPMGNKWVATSPYLEKDEKQKEIDKAMKFMLEDNKMDQYTDGLKVYISDRNDDVKYQFASDKISISPYILNTQVDTWYHEIGHRVHQLLGEKDMMTPSAIKRNNFKEFMTEDKWKEWKKVANKYYEANLSNVADDLPRMEYPLNSINYYKSQFGRAHKNIYYMEMFAELTAYYVHNPEDHWKLERDYPGLLQYMEDFYQMGNFKPGGKQEEFDLKRFVRLKGDEHDIAQYEKLFYENMPVGKRRVVRDYTGSLYEYMNEQLRGMKDHTERKPNLKKQIDLLDETIKEYGKPLEKDIITHRHMHGKMIGILFGDDVKVKARELMSNPSNEALLNDIKKVIGNTIVEDKGFLSTSHDEKFDTFRQHNGITYEIHLPEGFDNGIFVEHVSKFKQEKEYLINKGQQFKIVDVESKDNQLHLKVVPVMDDKPKATKKKTKPKPKQRGTIQKLGAKVEKELLKTETKIKSGKVETAVIYNEKGKKLYEKDGTHNSVQVGGAAAAGLLKGNILTHNHPSGTPSFSPADVGLLLDYRMKEMRCVTPEGHIARIALPDNGGYFTLDERKEIMDMAERLNKETQKKFLAKIQDGTMTREQAKFEHWHVIWTEVAKKYDLKYERILNNEE
jgi:hypothetical protein